MIVRLRPTKDWTFEEKLCIVAVGSSGSIHGAVRATKLPRSEVLDHLVRAVKKLPATDLDLPVAQYAVLWWRGIDYQVWTGYDLDGKEVRTITATLWHDDYYQLRKKHHLAKGDPVPQIEATRAQEIVSGTEG